MFGLKLENEKYVFTAAVKTGQLYLNLYKGERLKTRIAFDPELRIGDVWRLELSGDLSAMSYAYEADGKIFADPNGTVFSGRRKFGVVKDGVKILKTPIADAVSLPDYNADWEKDRVLNIPYEDSIIYRIHVRGFTKHRSSMLPPEERGSFQGIIRKLPYLKELGVTAIELMPPYEFNEVMLPRYGAENPFQPEVVPTGQINYWGFTQDAMMLAPKAGYTADHQNPKEAFRRLVLACHQAGIEVVVDLYFGGGTAPDYILTVLRYWRVAYHIDGVHLIGEAPLGVISQDPYLSRFKIWADSWEGCREQTGGYGDAQPRYLADYNQGFQNDMRRILKGDEDMLQVLMQRIRKNPQDRAGIQFMANAEGMTLMDVVSYDRKHNEANKENNLDGTDTNFSWNCGEEGPTRKKRLNQLRRRQLRNAWLLLLLSQGTPLIHQGDEFGQSKEGNNNAYCQDNDINWLDWGLLKKHQDIYDFVRFAIQFRRKHRVFHQAAELRNLDYKNTGIPDMSYHGENAWRPELENFRRQLGVMYSGAYAEDDTFYVIYNFHWEPHTFHVPNPPKGYLWALAVNTEDEANNGFYPEGTEPLLAEKACLAGPRSIIVLRAVADVSVQPEKEKPKRRRRGRQGKLQPEHSKEQRAGQEAAEDDSRRRPKEMQSGADKEAQAAEHTAAQLHTDRADQDIVADT